MITGIHGVFELLEIETSPKRVIITLLLWIICVLPRQLLELVQDVVCDQIREWCDSLVDDGELVCTSGDNDAEAVHFGSGVWCSRFLYLCR